MTGRRYSDQRWDRLGKMGRITLAIGAGVGFAILAWEPAPSQKPADGRPEGAADPDAVPVMEDEGEVDDTAVWQSIVKEDGALPQLEAQSAVAKRQLEWGLLGTGSAERVGRFSGMAIDAPEDPANRSQVPVKREDEAGTMTAVLPHSRAPPE